MFSKYSRNESSTIVKRASSTERGNSDVMRTNRDSASRSILADIWGAAESAAPTAPALVSIHPAAGDNAPPKMRDRCGVELHLVGASVNLLIRTATFR